MSPRTLNTTRKFDKAVALAKRRCKDMAKLRAVIDLLALRQALPRELKDHPLKGDWKNYRDLYIEPDWLLLYKADDANLWLVHTGTHSDIFGT